ncbi:MAG: DUF2442 domain-containing protein [Candidatus Kapaibacterium sp.]|nr:MAG: DUF2442 domain-containing protein [Candidatus Kapabacteria bacterium]
METAEEIIDITRAEYVSGYRIFVAFSNGVERVLDFEPFLQAAKNPMTRKYLDLQAFQSFSLDNGDLQWNDFELCFQLHNLLEGKI